MPSTTLKRLTTLETNMADMMAAVTRATNAVTDFKYEMSDFKNEMSDFKNEMSDFKNEMRASLESLSSEMRAAEARSAREGRAAEARSEREGRALNQRLGEIANNQGRLVEDVVAPSLPRILRSVLGLAPDAPVAPSGPRLRLGHPRHPGRMREFDVVAGHDGVVLVTEVKGRLTPGDVKRFADGLAEAREYLAPLGARHVLGAVAALYVDPSLVKRATRLGLLVLGVGEEMMEVKNASGFVPKRF